MLIGMLLYVIINTTSSKLSAVSTFGTGRSR